MKVPVTVACIQAEPVILDRDATIEKLGRLAAEAAGNDAKLLVFPEAFIPAYPSSVWARALAGWQEPGAKEAFALLARESLEVPSEPADRLAEIARENEVWLVTGVTERDPERPGTLYNTLLYHAPDGSLALKHRKLVPTNHERLVWGQGDGEGLRAIETGIGRIGGLICWSGRPRTRKTFRLRACSRGSTSWAAAAARFSLPTAPTSPGRSTARRESSTPSSTRPGWTRSASASIRPVTTTAPTCSAYALRPTSLAVSLSLDCDRKMKWSSAS